MRLVSKGVNSIPPRLESGFITLEDKDRWLHLNLNQLHDSLNHFFEKTPFSEYLNEEISVYRLLFQHVEPFVQACESIKKILSETSFRFKEFSFLIDSLYLKRPSVLYSLKTPVASARSQIYG